MNKLLFSIVLLFSGIGAANAQTTSINQPGIGGSTASASVIVTTFPNPVIDIVTVAFDGPIKAPIIETFNVNGQKVQAPVNGLGDGSNKTEVDLSNQAPGIYILKVFSAGEFIYVQKILKN